MRLIFLYENIKLKWWVRSDFPFIKPASIMVCLKQLVYEVKVFRAINGLQSYVTLNVNLISIEK